MAEWCEIPPGTCVPFWPMSTGSSKQVVVRIGRTLLESQPFNITETHATFLQIYHEVCVSYCLYVWLSRYFSVYFSVCLGFLSHCVPRVGPGAVTKWVSV